VPFNSGYLQALGELGAYGRSTVVFPIPIDLAEPLKRLLRR